MDGGNWLYWANTELADLDLKKEQTRRILHVIWVLSMGMNEYRAMSRSNIVHLPSNLTKLAIHNCNDQQNKNRNDRDSYNPIRSHSACSSVTPSSQ